MKDHEIAQTVNELRDLAIKFHDHQSLRGRIADVIVTPLKRIAELEAQNRHDDEADTECRRLLMEENDALRSEIDRLKECAQQQAQGTNGCKTIRVELIPKGNQVSCCVTFPSSFPDGEKTAAETAASMLALLYETANGLAKAQA